MKIIDIKSYRLLMEERKSVALYRQQILIMSKPDLLMELIQYHERFVSDPLDLQATLKGQALMEVLEDRAELSELKELSREFKAKLNQRLSAQLMARGSYSSQSVSTDTPTH